MSFWSPPAHYEFFGAVPSLFLSWGPMNTKFRWEILDFSEIYKGKSGSWLTEKVCPRKKRKREVPVSGTETFFREGEGDLKSGRRVLPVDVAGSKRSSHMIRFATYQFWRFCHMLWFMRACCRKATVSHVTVCNIWSLAKLSNVTCDICVSICA